MKLSKRFAAVAAALAFSVVIAGCSSSGSSDSGDSAASAESSAPAESAPAASEAAPSADESSAAAAADPLAEAAARMVTLAGNPPLDLAPLSQSPEPGLKLASVTCNILACYPGEIEKAGAALGWEVTEETYDLAKGPADFKSAVRRALETNPDMMSILFVYPKDTIKDELEQAMADGVVLVDIASQIDRPDEGWIGCVYCNEALGGYAIALSQWIAVDDAGAGSGVAVVGDKTIAAHVASGAAAKGELARLMPDSEITDVNVSFAATPQENNATVIAALQRNPGIKYLHYQTPDLLGGLDQALEAAGLADKVMVVAPGPSTGEALMSVQQGFPKVWMSTGAQEYMWEAVDILARDSVGDTFEPVPMPPLALVTAENASPDLLYPPNFEESYKQAWGVQ